MCEYIVNYDSERHSLTEAMAKKLCEIDFDKYEILKIQIPNMKLHVLFKHRSMWQGYPVEEDNRLHRGQFCFILEEKRNEDPLNLKSNPIDPYYIVTIKEQYQDKLQNTTCRHKFCGKLVNQTDRFYFELNNSKALVIIPHEWVECMAPSKALWDLEIERRKKNAQ